jgi:hypothetical protein
MNIILFFVRLICLSVGLWACSSTIPKVVKADSTLVEDSEEDCPQIIEDPRKQSILPLPKKRKRHRFGDHLILERLHTTNKTLKMA